MKVVLKPWAFKPERAHATDAGLDLRTPKDVLIPPRGSAVIDTGVAIELPKNHYGKIESKSGLNVNASTVCCGGVVDEGYTGDIVVKLYNLSDIYVKFNRGDKVAQLLVCPCAYPEIEVVSKIKGGARGKNGFGSTGR